MDDARPNAEGVRSCLASENRVGKSFKAHNDMS